MEWVAGFLWPPELLARYRRAIAQRDNDEAASGLLHLRRAITLALHEGGVELLPGSDPVKDIRNTSDIRGVMVRGRWLGEKERRARLADIAERYAE